MNRLFVAAAAMLMAAGAAQADPTVQVGELRCELLDKTNLIITSTTNFDCAFTPNGDTASEAYVGTSRRLGLDLTVTQAETLVWLVFAPSNDVPSGALSGSYAGASADIAIGIGVGAKVLLGGSGNAFALQPVSLAGRKGAGAALAVEEFALEEAQ